MDRREVLTAIQRIIKLSEENALFRFMIDRPIEHGQHVEYDAKAAAVEKEIMRVLEEYPGAPWAAKQAEPVNEVGLTATDNDYTPAPSDHDTGWVDSIYKMGIRAYQMQGKCPFDADSVAEAVWTRGWYYEKLRIDHIRGVGPSDLDAEYEPTSIIEFYAEGTPKNPAINPITFRVLVGDDIQEYRGVRSIELGGEIYTLKWEDEKGIGRRKFYRSEPKPMA